MTGQMKQLGFDRVAICGVLVLLAAGCSKRAPQASRVVADEAKKDEAPDRFAETADTMRSGTLAGPGGARRATLAKKVAKLGALKILGAEGGSAGLRAGLRGPSDAAKRPAVTRSWFPETFLFEPRVVTDDNGAAGVSVRVPDRLTTWRVLGLAHDRTGRQAGHLTSFVGTLPVYVEPVVPRLLRVGDRARLPMTLVNTTREAVSARLSVTSVGARLTGGEARVTIPAGGSLVHHITLTAEQPGTVTLSALLGEADAVVRTLRVVPRGRPVSRSFGGTLAAARRHEVKAVEGADPLGKVRLQVFPGALSVVRSELSRSADRDHGLAGDAYALLLTGSADKILKLLGDSLDKAGKQRLRDLTVLAGQRVFRRARVLTMDSATLLAGPAAAHPDNPLLARLAKRARQTIQTQQAPDGTCGGETGWPLQRLLLATAGCGKAAARRTVLVAASGAFERNLRRIDDPYTAAAVLASGALSGQLAALLRKQVLAGIVTVDGGAKALKLTKGVVRADGRPPVRAEATAMAILALSAGDQAKREQALLADLGATLLADYAPDHGWGDGRANLACLRAVARLFQKPLPRSIRLSLKRDGQTVAESTLDRRKLKDVVLLEASGDSRQKASWEVEAEPALPGLGYRLQVTHWVPWRAAQSEGGVQLSVTRAEAPVVGSMSRLTVSATAPQGAPLTITLDLPAGVQPDDHDLKKMKDSGAISGFTATVGQLKLTIPAQQTADLFQATIPMIPTLAGTLSSGPATLQVQTKTVQIPPATWTIKPNKK